MNSNMFIPFIRLIVKLIYHQVERATNTQSFSVVRAVLSHEK